MAQRNAYTYIDSLTNSNNSNASLTSQYTH